MTTAAPALDAIPAMSARRARAAVLRLAPVIAGAIALAVGMFLIDGLPVGVAHDDGMYVLLAKALATGQGYRWLNLPDAPPATHFPPGYPAVLALLWWLFPAFPANVVKFKLANAVFAAAAAVGTARFAERRLGMHPLSAAAFALVAMLGIPTLTLSAMVMSEPLFLALLLPLLLLAERVLDRADDPRRETFALLALGLLVGAATLVRSHGIALVAAVTLLLLARRRFRAAVIFASSTLVFLLPWQLWVSARSGLVPETMRGNYESYGAWLAAGVRADGLSLILHTVARTSGELAAMCATLAAPSMPPWTRSAAVVALALLGALGARALWRRAPVTALFLFLYLAIVVAWPFTPARFVWGIWPLVLALPLLGTRELWGWSAARLRDNRARLVLAVRGTGLACAALLALGYGAYTLRGYRGHWWSSIPRSGAKTLLPLVNWAATRTRPGDVLAVEEESVVYLYALRSAVPVHTFTAQQYLRPRTPLENAAAIQAVLAHYPIRAVVMSSLSMRAAARELTIRPNPLLAVTDTFPGGIVLTPISR